jgi:hypothetical protein
MVERPSLREEGVGAGRRGLGAKKGEGARADAPQSS